MNELERAATALRERPPAQPAQLESLEHRAVSLRRRRRLLEAGAVALVMLLLGTAGLALSAARSDDDRGVFVGEGPSESARLSGATYRLSRPLDEDTARSLEQTIEARFRWAWAGDVVVRVVGSELRVSASAPKAAYLFDELVTQRGGFQLRTVGGEAPEAVCRASGPPYGSPEAYWTVAVSGPPRCLWVGPYIDLPYPSAVESGISTSASGGYQTDVSLVAAATHAFLVSTSTCPDWTDAACLPSTIGIVSGNTILHPSALVSVRPRTEDRLEVVDLAVPGFPDDVDANLWAAVLVHPLPENVLLTRIADDPGD